MKAFVLPDESRSASFKDIPVPEPGPGEMRVAVRTSSVNGFDVFVASGMARPTMEHQYPVVLGKDFAGVVDELGEGVERFAVGDEVMGILPPEEFLGRGAYAESIALSAEAFVELKPSTLTFEEAASVGLAALTAYVAVEAVEPSYEDAVLVAGATGGVGSYAVQFATRSGASVIASSLPADDAWIRSLGASETVDYMGDAVAAIRASHPDGVDALIDAVNRGHAHQELAALVRDGGHVASTTGSADVGALKVRGIAATNVVGQSDPAAFAEVVRMAGDGELEIPIKRTFAFEELPQALGLVGSRSSRGKTAVAIA